MNCASQVYNYQNRSRNKVYACSWSLNKFFGSSNIQFQHKTWNLASRNLCCDVQNEYRTILERSHTICFDTGSIDNFKIIPILAGLMIALTSLFHANSNITNNIQSDHQHSLSSANAAENYHPINFFLRYSNPGLDSPLVNKSPSCSAVEVLSNLFSCFTISSQSK